MCLENAGDNPQIQCKVLKCFSSWVTVQAMTLNDVANNVVVATAFTILANRMVSILFYNMLYFNKHGPSDVSSN